MDRHDTTLFLIKRHKKRLEEKNLHICDSCNVLTLNCQYCDLSSDFHADLCDTGALLMRVCK